MPFLFFIQWISKFPAIAHHIVEDHTFIEDQIIEDNIIEDHKVEDQFIEYHIIEDNIIEDHRIEDHIIEYHIIEDHIIEDHIIEDHTIGATLEVFFLLCRHRDTFTTTGLSSNISSTVLTANALKKFDQKVSLRLKKECY